MSRLELSIASGSLLQFYQALWGPIYEAVLDILGSTGVILPIGDPHHGQPNATTFVTVGGEQVAFTWSEAPASFDTPLDLTDKASFQGVIPIVTFNGTDEEADTPDAAFWTRDDAAGANGFSIGAWFNLADATSSGILGRHAGGSNREWQFFINGNDKLYLELLDFSADVVANRIADAVITEGVFHFVVCTYDGAGGAAAADTIILYEDGVVKTSTGTNNGAYVGMEDRAVATRTDPGSQFFNGKLAGGPLGMFFTHAELTADQVLRLYQFGRKALGL
jgi:hypothetical protein